METYFKVKPFPLAHLEHILQLVVMSYFTVTTSMGWTQLPAGTRQLHMNQLFWTIMGEGAIPDHICNFYFIITFMYISQLGYVDQHPSLEINFIYSSS